MRIFNIGYSNDFDGPGTRLVFYLKGCNFRCNWCGAPESLSPEVQTLCYPERTVIAGHDIQPELILDKALAAKDFIDGVTFGGGEPLLQYKELFQCLNLLRKAGIHTALESNASTSAYRAAVLMVDWLYSDLKTLDIEKFETQIHTDAGKLTQVCENLRFAAVHQRNFVLRIPIITDLNDDQDSQEQLLEFCLQLNRLRSVEPLRVQLLRQHHIALPKYHALKLPYPCEGAKLPSRKNLELLAKTMTENGLNTTLFG